MVKVEASEFPAYWAGLINKGAVEEVIALYNNKATLMPTFSPHMVRDEKGLTEYFTQLASRSGLEVALHAETVEVVEVGGSVFSLNGIYSFKFEVDGTLLTFPSRFTFVVDLSDDAPILHHHSSQIPRTLS